MYSCFPYVQLLCLFFDSVRLILRPNVSAGNLVSRNGKSFDVRFKADLEGGQSGPPTPPYCTPDEAYAAPKTYLPMRLANLQTTYHDDQLGSKADSGSQPAGNPNAEAQAQTAKAEEYMEVCDRSHMARYAEPQPLRWAAKCWVQLKILFGKAQRASSCMKKNAVASKGSTSSKCLSKQTCQQ